MNAEEKNAVSQYYWLHSAQQARAELVEIGASYKRRPELEQRLEYCRAQMTEEIRREFDESE